MVILGLSAFYHDSASCIVVDGHITAAAQEERFSRKKHDESFPLDSINFCLRHSKLKPADIDLVVFYEKPFIKFERLLETYLAFAPKGFQSFSKAMPLWIKDKIFQKNTLISNLKLVDKNIDWKSKLLFSEHHLSHAASAYYPSPFNQAAILTLDGVGEWTTTSLALGLENKIEIKEELQFPHSLGLLYSAFTYYLGFRVNSGEYKVMGLAPYGQPKYTKLIFEKLLTLNSDGSFQLDMSFFNFATGLSMTNNKFHDLFGGPPRTPETEINQHHMDLAASIQNVIEEIVLLIVKHIAQKSDTENLCLAGGVALNCVSNGVISRSNLFKNIWIQPASGDAGCAVGAALTVWHQHLGNLKPRCSGRDRMSGSYLGPKFSDVEIETELRRLNGTFEKLNDEELFKTVALALAQDKAVGWMQGRMEFGPRALGNRSILANPGSKNMQKNLNLKIKFRESFRPFAPSVLEEDAREWFENITNSPYMLNVFNLTDEKKRSNADDDALFGLERLKSCRSEIPAVTHVDYSARVQTVNKKTNPRFHKLISNFKPQRPCFGYLLQENGNLFFRSRGQDRRCNLSGCGTS